MNGGNADTITIESDEHGFELHIETDEGDRFVFNVHDVAEDLMTQAITKIAPWVLEGRAAKREYDSGVADDPTQQIVLDRIKADPYPDDNGPWPGESALAFWQRTGQDEPLRDQADTLNKARKEN